MSQPSDAPEGQWLAWHGQDLRQGCRKAPDAALHGDSRLGLVGILNPHLDTCSKIHEHNPVNSAHGQQESGSKRNNAWP